MMKRIQARMDKEGVSEVLGSILTLIVTVTLFSSIFIGVQSLQAPDKGNYIEFETTFEEGKDNYYLNITNVGDGTLTSQSSVNLVNDDGLTISYDFSNHSNKNGWNLGHTLNLKLEKDNEIFDSNIELLIIDKKNSRVVWRDDIKTGDTLAPIIQDYGVNYPQDWESYTLADEKVTFWTDVIDRDTNGNLDVTVNISKLEGHDGLEELKPVSKYKQKESNTFKTRITLDDRQPNGTYLLKLNATDGVNENKESHYFVLHVGEFAVAEDADLQVSSNKFISSPETPQNGQNYSITAPVYNDGGKKATADIEFWDQHPDGKSYLVETVRNVSFPIGGGRDVRANWVVNNSGTHDITVRATNVSNGRGGEGSKEITVSPKILVVEDGIANSPRNEAKSMVDALRALDFEYDTYKVDGGDGPDYDSGPNALIDYDIVIWMTGSQKSNTLTRSDRDNLKEYLNATRKLWLIGEGIGNDGSASSWVESNMNVDFPDDQDDLDSKPESPMVGNDIPFKSDEEFHFEEQFAEDSDKIYSASGANESLEDDSGDCYMVSYDAPERGGERTVFQSFTFSSLNEELTGSRTRLAYKVIMWLGNMSKRSGNDLAVSSQEISDPSPKYMDTLNISATIRNNGNENLTTEAVLEIDGSIVKQNESIEIDSEDTTSVNFQWLADELGRHEVLVIVDPFNEIEENNELNNDISYQNGIPEINVEFTTLIVDDDHEDEKSKNSTYYVENAYKSLDYTYDMFYSSEEESGPHVDEMKYYNSVCWVTGSVDDPFHDENGLNIDIDNITKYLEEYESNFILIGDRVLNNIPEDFRKDKLKIESNGSSIYSPPSLLKGVKEDPITHGFEYRLKEDISTDPYHYDIMDGAKPIFESKNNDIYSHRYQDHSSNFKLTYLGVDPMHFKRAFRVDDEKNETRWYKEYDYVLNGTPMREELFYKINQWFGQYDDRIELRVSDIDVEVSTKHPTLVIGSSFVISAKIENMGGTEADALIRFKDGDTHIKTESMYLPAHSRKTIEVKWKPVHAGEDRPVRVIVDPLGEVGEIPNDPGSNNQKDHLGFNNQAIIYTDVFYFWDDMENGTANWQHETNLAQINGEVPLDYMGGQYGSLDTDIASEWESNESVEKVDWDSHSDPNSYLMEETEGTIEGEADVFLGIVLDNSHSMANRHYPEGEDNPTWLDHAKEGAISLVNSLSNKSVVCVWNFSGQNVAQAVQPTQLTENGRQNVISGIYGIEEKPITSIWDATGNAYMDVINNIDNYDQDLMPAVTILGDGGDIHSADGSANLKMLESGSKDWAPWGKMKPEQNYTEEEYPSHLGKYQFPYNDYTPSDNGEWLRANGERGGPQYEPYRKGLLYSDIPIYTIGLGVEHFDNIPNWEEVTTYDEPDDGDVNQYDVYKNPSGPNAPKNKEAGTLEYNLWRIATTSDAEYFFAPDPKNLTNIFSQIGQLIAKPGNVTSVDMNDNSIKSWDNPNPKEVENKDKWAVTPEIDIEDMDSAYLTFWHKYKLLNGVNGGFIELNYTEHNEWQGWKYVKPSIGPYSGNLLLSGDLPKDDHNNEIRWCWNGRSADGTLDWEYVRVNLFRHIPDDAEKLKVRFYYKQYGGSNEPGGWLIDDVSITGSRKTNAGITSEQMDVWQYVSENGNQAWYNGINYNAPEQQRFRGGIDNRLVSSGIDLTNARTAKLSADFKFNINEKSGRPPDGFRVEITTDNGITWESINLGSRAASGYSDGWVSAEEGNNSLTRLLLDLSDFSGETIMIRFRVVTNNVQYHWAVDPSTSGADYGGLYLDNVIISGVTL